MHAIIDANVFFAEDVVTNFCLQMFNTYTFNMRLLDSDIANRGKGELVLYGKELLFSIWNLDSPRLVYASFVFSHTQTLFKS